MFLGHYGLALALKREEPKVSLGTLFIATQLVDILWGGSCCWAGSTCGSCPTTIRCSRCSSTTTRSATAWSARSAWGLAAAARSTTPGRRAIRRRHWQAAALVGAAVASHWLLDLIVHVPDLPLAGNDSPKFGLGLWRHVGVSVGARAAGARRRAGALLPAAVAPASGSARSGWRVVLLLLVAPTWPRCSGRRRRASPVIGVSVIVLLLGLGALAAWADRRATPAELAAAAIRRGEPSGPAVLRAGRAAPAFLAVAAGAFGAHALRARLPPDLLGVVRDRRPLPDVSRARADGRGLGGEPLARRHCRSAAGWLFVAGTVLFSGSLYALALSGVRWLGAITPLGGVAFLAGWVCLGARGRRGVERVTGASERGDDASSHRDPERLPRSLLAPSSTPGSRAAARDAGASSPAAAAAAPAATARSTSPWPTLS